MSHPLEKRAAPGATTPAGTPRALRRCLGCGLRSQCCDSHRAGGLLAPFSRSRDPPVLHLDHCGAVGVGCAAIFGPGTGDSMARRRFGPATRSHLSLSRRRLAKCDRVPSSTRRRPHGRVLWPAPGGRRPSHGRGGEDQFVDGGAEWGLSARPLGWRQSSSVSDWESRSRPQHRPA